MHWHVVLRGLGLLSLASAHPLVDTERSAPLDPRAVGLISPVGPRVPAQVSAKNPSVIQSRAPGKKGEEDVYPVAPLPARMRKTEGDPKFIRWMREQGDLADIDGGLLNIKPSDKQLQGWVIDGVPIGATAEWRPWPKDVAGATTWRMWGLIGCTATIIVSQDGFWAGHLWESVRASNPVQGSSFKYRPTPGDDPVDRPLDVFQKIAVDIHNQPAPAAADTYISLSDMRAKHGNPFTKEKNVEVLIMTKTETPLKPNRPLEYETTPVRRFDQQITALRDGYKRAIPGLQDEDIHEHLYSNNRKTDGDVQGMVLIQYSPVQEIVNGAKKSVVRVYTEDYSTPHIDMEWCASA